eukprot:2907558-Amphidinium_carterae.2
MRHLGRQCAIASDSEHWISDVIRHRLAADAGIHPTCAHQQLVYKHLYRRPLDYGMLAVATNTLNLPCRRTAYRHKLPVPTCCVHCGCEPHHANAEDFLSHCTHSIATTWRRLRNVAALAPLYEKTHTTVATSYAYTFLYMPMMLCVVLALVLATCARLIDNFIIKLKLDSALLQPGQLRFF